MAMAMACVLGLAVLFVGQAGRHGRRADIEAPRRSVATPAMVQASLADGVAWIWPDSNGPPARRADTPLPYREAALLVESLVWRADGVERGGRSQPLALPAGLRIIPVVHVEAAEDAPDQLTATQLGAILAAVHRHAPVATSTQGAGLLQLDFEAPLRQREAYRALVARIRAALPAQVRLSVTALAHWCTQGDWLDRLPVDEVVPMLYRLGSHATDWQDRFTTGAPTLAHRCRGPALGFATNDPPSPALLARAARPYWFDESVWSNPSRPPRPPTP